MSPVLDDIQQFPSSILKNTPGTEQAKLYQLFATQMDELETVRADLYQFFDIANQVGINLDLIGELLGEARKGKTDEDYRLFLQIAIMRLASRGDINSINAIAAALGFTNINIEEIYRVGYVLDSSMLLDGTWLLNGEHTPAAFTFFRELSVDDATPDFAIAEMIDSVRAAGVDAQIAFNFIVLESDSVVYTNYTGLLDDTWFLDGKKMLSGTSEMILTPNEIAIGDGAQPGGVGPVRTPLPGDSGLQNELLRVPVTTIDLGGERIHVLEIGRDELGGDDINEIGIFRDSSPILIESFESKAKDLFTKFIFKYKEDVLS